LRTKSGQTALQPNAQLASLARQVSGNHAAGTPLPFDPDAIVYQGCQIDEAWNTISRDPIMRLVLLNPNFVEAGIGAAPGTLNTFAIKFAAVQPTQTATPAPTPTDTPSPTRRPPTATPLSELELDWSLEYRGVRPSNPDEWLIIANLEARGGDGKYQYYHDGLPVNSPRVEIVYQACRNKPGSFWVRDGAGQIVKKAYYFFPAYCPG